MLAKLGDVWATRPDLSLGQLVEQIENTAWDFYYEKYPTRHFSMRLAHLSDADLEAALNKWVAGKATVSKFYDGREGKTIE